MNVTDRVKAYIRLVTDEIVADHNGSEARYELYAEMSKEERELVNEIIELVFGEYL